MPKLTEELDKLSDLQLLEHLQLLEDFINEATWYNVNRFHDHYQKHVLEEDEPFNEDDPKFKHMSEEEFREMAETFSELDANKALYKMYKNEDGTDKPIMDLYSDVVGFMLKPEQFKQGRVPRKAKIVVTPKKYLPDGVDGKKFRTLVVYVDENGKSEIVSCYLLRPTKMKGLFRYQYDGELPENS